MVCLVPGLTGGQRRAVIRRLRQEASRGVGPALPLPQLAVALGLDRLRSAARIACTAVRLHPAVTLVPGALAAGMMALFLVASADASAIAGVPRDRLAVAVAGSARARLPFCLLVHTDQPRARVMSYVWVTMSG